jgi:outer membrane protein TolC
MICGSFSPLSGQTEEPSPRVTLAEAIARTLVDNPSVQAQYQRVEQAKGIKQSAAGAFDWVAFAQVEDETRRASILPAPIFPGLPTVARRDATSAAFGVGRQLGNGITVRPSVAVQSEEENTSTAPVVTRSDIGVTFGIPLARGFGRDATEADLRAGAIGLEARRELARQEIAGRVSRTASAYWRCLSAGERLALACDTEARAEKMMGIIRRLVEGGEIESAVLDEASADFLRRRSNRVDGEQELFEARLGLGVAMGLAPDELAEAPVAAENFPSVVAFDWKAEGMAGLTRLALERRGDLLAARLNEQVQDAYLRRARNDLRPRFDLSLRAAYTGAALDNDGASWEDSLQDELTGLNVTAGLSLEWPVRNRAARGEYRRRGAVLREAEINTIELRNAVAAAAKVAAETVRTSAQQHAIAAETSASFARVVENQRAKVANGEATLTALVQNEDRYFEARSAEIQLAQAYFTALVQLREVTGTLIERRAESYELALEAFAAPPLAP